MQATRSMGTPAVAPVSHGLLAKLRLKPTNASGAQPREQKLFSQPRYAGARHLQMLRKLASNVTMLPIGDV